MRAIVDGYLLLRHRLEHRRLNLGRGSIDLICEDDMRENRPAPKLKAPRLGIENIGPRNIARQEVGRKLDPPERGEIDVGVGENRLTERTRECRLSEIGRASGRER